MLETVIVAAVVAGFGTFVIRSRIRGESRFSKVESSWSNSLLSFAKDNGLEGLDLEFKNPKEIKKKSNGKEKVSFIAPTIDKGYDLIDTTVQQGYSFGQHFHRGSSEFFYVLSGKIRIEQCVNDPSDCIEKCRNICGLYTNVNYNENNIVNILNAGDSLFIPASKFHTFEALEESRVIVVTLPPISEIHHKKAV